MKPNVLALVPIFGALFLSTASAQGLSETADVDLYCSSVLFELAVQNYGDPFVA
jgi:hypothetical protein